MRPALLGRQTPTVHLALTETWPPLSGCLQSSWVSAILAILERGPSTVWVSAILFCLGVCNPWVSVILRSSLQSSWVLQSSSSPLSGCLQSPSWQTTRGPPGQRQRAFSGALWLSLVTIQEVGGQGRYQVVLEEVHIVQQIFHRIGRERISLSEVSRRLEKQEVSTRTVLPRWSSATIARHINNPAFIGQATFERASRRLHATVGPRPGRGGLANAARDHCRASQAD
jgi:Recombinase